MMDAASAQRGAQATALKQGKFQNECHLGQAPQFDSLPPPGVALPLVVALLGACTTTLGGDEPGKQRRDGRLRRWLRCD